MGSSISHRLSASALRAACGAQRRATPLPSLRVLHLDTERGWRGGQNQVWLLHRGLLRAGIDSTVLCRGGEPLAERLAAERLPHVAVPPGPLLTVRAAGMARAHDATVLHAHASGAHGIALLAGLGRGTPLLVTRRVDFPLKRGRVARWKYGPRVTRFIAVSQAVGRVLAGGGVDERRITVIPSGVEPQAVHPFRPDLPADHVLVLCAAALEEHKGHRHLLDAWRTVEAAGARATLLLAGSGSLDAPLRAQAAGLTQVRFLGWRDDLPQLWAGADIAVLSSVTEGLGTALIDAQLHGLPVVGSAAGGIPEVVADGRSGLLSPPGDSAALAANLLRLIGDTALRVRLSLGAREHARGFLAETMVARYRDLYGEVLGCPAG